MGRNFYQHQNMAATEKQHWGNVIDVIHTANEHLDDFNIFRNQVLMSLQKVIHVDTCNFFIYDDNLQAFNPVAINIREKYLQQYQEHYYRYDPFNLTHGYLQCRPVVSDSVLFQSSEFKNSIFYNDFLQSHDVSRQLVLFLRGNRRMLGFIGLHRSDEKAEFTTHELALAEAMVPMLSQSLEKAFQFDATQAKLTHYQTILNRSSAGVLMLSNKMTHLFSNDIAKGLLEEMRRQGFELATSNDSLHNLPKIVFDICRELRPQGTHKKTEGAAQTLQKDFTLRNGTTITLNAEILEQASTGFTPPLFVITFETKAEKQSRINEYLLQNEMGFTKREIELVHYLFKGLKNTEIAELLSITEGTVKNHLRNIFDKMGVTNRTSLIYEILSL